MRRLAGPPTEHPPSTFPSQDPSQRRHGIPLPCHSSSYPHTRPQDVLERTRQELETLGRAALPAPIGDIKVDLDRPGHPFVAVLRDSQGQRHLEKAEDEAASPQEPRFSPILPKTRTPPPGFFHLLRSKVFCLEKNLLRLARMYPLEKNRSVLKSFPMVKGHSWDFSAFFPTPPRPTQEVGTPVTFVPHCSATDSQWPPPPIAVFHLCRRNRLFQPSSRVPTPYPVLCHFPSCRS